MSIFFNVCLKSAHNTFKNISMVQPLCAMFNVRKRSKQNTTMCVNERKLYLEQLQWNSPKQRADNLF